METCIDPEDAHLEIDRPWGKTHADQALPTNSPPTLLPPSIWSHRETHMCLDTLGPQTQPCMQSHRDKYTDISVTRHNICTERGEGREGVRKTGREKKRQ